MKWHITLASGANWHETVVTDIHPALFLAEQNAREINTYRWYIVHSMELPEDVATKLDDEGNIL